MRYHRPSRTSDRSDQRQWTDKEKTWACRPCLIVDLVFSEQPRVAARDATLVFLLGFDVSLPARTATDYIEHIASHLLLDVSHETSLEVAQC